MLSFLARLGGAALLVTSSTLACASSSDDDGGVPSTAAPAPTGNAPRACYSGSRAGCQDISWSTIEIAIEGAFATLGAERYHGYTKADAKATARALYDHGTLPGARLSLFHARTVDGKTSRVLASVLDAAGRPQAGLAAPAFDVGGSSPSRVLRLGDATRDDVRLRIATVVDDSGSIGDCDAQFVADGLAHLFEVAPPVYEAELVKFATDVETVRPFTSDAAALASTARGSCTDRGATSLWDAVQVGLADLRASTDDHVPILVVFSDGLDNDSRASFADVAAAAAAGRVPTLVAGLGSADPFALGDLARVTGGAFVYAPSGDRALDLFRTLTSVLVEAYVVDVPPGAATLTVRLPDGQTLTADIP